MPKIITIFLIYLVEYIDNIQDRMIIIRLLILMLIRRHVYSNNH